MRSDSHTLIGIVRQHVSEWRREQSWSRETVVVSIVDAHEAIGAPARTGIRFEPSTQDSYERTKVNADRVFRWLDDESKDTNLLPANFLLSILAALPPARRHACLNALLAPLGLHVQGNELLADCDIDVNLLAASDIKEGSEAVHALLGLQGHIDEVSLCQAEKEYDEAIESYSRTRRALEAIHTKLRNGAAVIRRVVTK
jgi:hypothetical protein